MPPLGNGSLAGLNPAPFWHLGSTPGGGVAWMAEWLLHYPAKVGLFGALVQIQLQA